MPGPKQLERLVLNKYLELTDQEFQILETESPDFILTSGDLNIGCEVTEYFPDYSSCGSNLRMRNAFIDTLNQKLREQLLELYPKGYSFTIHYSSESPGRTQIADEVNDVLQKIQSVSSKENIINPSPNINSIRIKSIGEYPSRILLFLSSKYESPSVDWIKPIIDSKTKKSTQWTNSFDHLWLLISVGLSRSTDLDLRKIRLSKELLGEVWGKIALVDVPLENFVEIDAI
jgi:hypothetical protein